VQHLEVTRDNALLPTARYWNFVHQLVFFWSKNFPLPGNLKIRYHLHISPPLNLILSHLNPFFDWLDYTSSQFFKYKSKICSVFLLKWQGEIGNLNPLGIFIKAFSNPGPPESSPFYFQLFAVHHATISRFKFRHCTTCFGLLGHHQVRSNLGQLLCLPRFCDPCFHMYSVFKWSQCSSSVCATCIVAVMCHDNWCS
jgi:hypothetical protein